MPILRGMAQVWFVIQFIATVVGAVVSDGNERRNMALVAIFGVFGLVGAIRRQRGSWNPQAGTRPTRTSIRPAARW